ncbi:hypothetical protein C8J57DRAFT_1252440 [Mycena rebaudengoi]|nr:hypothetical protein C8J57DRAFT_1252440 [Mycena rebaudengoi]
MKLTKIKLREVETGTTVPRGYVGIDISSDSVRRRSKNFQDQKEAKTIIEVHSYAGIEPGLRASAFELPWYRNPCTQMCAMDYELDSEKKKKKKEGKPVLLGKVKRPDLQIDMLKKKEPPDVLGASALKLLTRLPTGQAGANPKKKRGKQHKEGGGDKSASVSIKLGTVTGNRATKDMGTMEMNGRRRRRRQAIGGSGSGSESESDTKTKLSAGSWGKTKCFVLKIGRVFNQRELIE